MEEIIVSKTKENSSSSPQCQYFVVRKKRLCRMTVRPGRNYCGEHEPQPRLEKGRDDTRIPCPNDPKHTCYASKLLKHLAICNARQQQQPAYIVHNVNAPQPTSHQPRKLLSQIPQHKILALIRKVNILYDKYVKDEIITIEEKPIHAVVLEDFNEEGRTESSLRHLRQASSLLHLMEAAGLVKDNTCYVEMGAGKGHLSYYAYTAWCRDNPSRVLLVDRASLRHKRDNKLREPRVRTGKEDSHIDNKVASGTDTKDVKITNKLATDGNVINTRDSNDTENIIDTVDTVDMKDISANTSDRGNNNAATGNRLQVNKAGSGTVTNDVMKNVTHDGEKRNAVVNGAIGSGIVISDVMKNTAHTMDMKDISATRDGNIAVEGATVSVNMANDITTNTADMDMKDISASDDGADSRSSNCLRLRADLAHLVLEKVPEVIESDAVVGFAKHLCGVAMDYALRCLTQVGAGKLRGGALATCCHHRCDAAAYVAGAQLQEMGVDGEDLNIMLGLVSWATCGDGRSRQRRRAARAACAADLDDKLLEEGLDVEADHEECGGAEALGTRGLRFGERRRAAAGRRAKAVLDLGRVRFLRERGLHARLCHYVPAAVSPENVCIVVTDGHPPLLHTVS